MAYLYDVTNNQYLGSVDLSKVADTSKLDANKYPASITSKAGVVYLINPKLPAGADGWAHVVYDGKLLALRAMTAAEIAAREKPAWVPTKAALAAKVQLLQDELAAVSGQVNALAPIEILPEPKP